MITYEDFEIANVTAIYINYSIKLPSEILFWRVHVLVAFPLASMLYEPLDIVAGTI